MNNDIDNKNEPIASKKSRVLDIFFRLFKGEGISVASLANEYNVSTKSISRDIAEIKNFLADNRELVGNSNIEYSSASRKHFFNYDQFLVSKELMTIVKVLIGSRALSNIELLDIVGKLKALTTRNDRGLLDKMIQNEMYYYKEVYHDCKSTIDLLWQLMRIIDDRKEITISYYKQDRSQVERNIKPVAIIFSEYYFYLLAYKEGNDKFPLHFRVDRIVNIVEHRKTYNINEYNFNEGKLKQEIQYMYPGVYRRIKFEFSGPSLQAVLDKMPTAKVIEKKGNVNIIEAYVYGTGINMFILSQGDWIKVLEPQEYVDELKGIIKNMYLNYQEN